MKLSALYLAGLVLGLGFTQSSGAQSTVAGSSHDFRVNGQTSNSESLCKSCHIPHKADPASPLWNPGQGGKNYAAPGTAGAEAATGGQDSSKVCLSCHDGTIALPDNVNNGRIQAKKNSSRLRPGTAAEHVTGMKIAASAGLSFPQVQKPASNDSVRVDPAGRVQCTSCHNAHDENRDPVSKRFLIKPNARSAICLSCHQVQNAPGAPVPWSWSGAGQVSDHKTRTNTYDETTNAPGESDSQSLGSHTGYKTVDSNGCEACHRPHAAHGTGTMLKGEIDQVCLQCHDGNPAAGTSQNIKSVFSRKQYMHPGTGASQSGHEATEAPIASSSRHATCADCHNAHAAKEQVGASASWRVRAPLVGVSGVSANGGPLDPRRGTGEAAHEYEICFKCHADSNNKPHSDKYFAYGATPFRASFQLGQDQSNYNTRLQFQSPVASHAVTQPATGTRSPSLRRFMLNRDSSPNTNRPLGAGNVLNCTDCHSNDQARAFGGEQDGANGPHGSLYPHLLERDYRVNTRQAGQAPGGLLEQAPRPPIPGANGTYGLCEKCHALSSSEGSCSVSNNSPLHRFHTFERYGFACSTCHASHGVANGNASNNAGLVDFDTTLVARNPNAPYATPQMIKSGNSATCSLVCHGVVHGTNGKGAMQIYSNCSF